MATISLTRYSPEYIPDLESYQMTLSVSSAEGITQYIFVKQRTLGIDKTSFVDTFVAISTPVQLQDFSQSAPTAPSSYFRDNTITLTAATIEYLNYIYNVILQDIQKLIIDVTYLATYSSQESQVITIDSNNIIIPPVENLQPAITITITGNNQTQNLDFSLTDYYILNMTGATGTLTLTITNLTVGQSSTIETIQSNSPINITFPNNTLQARGGGNNYIANPDDSVDLIYITFDGTNYLITNDAGYS